eukprot:Skav209080  [mRNA]  locus=scaffold207:373829:390485:+ [translate_table: standard]
MVGASGTAVKCYRQAAVECGDSSAGYGQHLLQLRALRFDPENMQILRDLSLLQIHRLGAKLGVPLGRDVTGFAETRRKLLQVDREIRRHKRRIDTLETEVPLSDQQQEDVPKPSNRSPATLRRYIADKVKVLKLPVAGEHPAKGSRVRAVLDSNGDGSVELASPYDTFDNSTNSKSVMAFLEDLGFWNDGDHLIQAVAKFWFAHGLGSLTVYPFQLATISAYDAMQSEQHVHEAYQRDLAFFLPAGNPGQRSKACIDTYGSRLARQVFNGGGPFILPDSIDLIPAALRRLGYLDDHMNKDLPEALFCFLNAPANKHQLRKSGFLPQSGARSSEICKILRNAFLCQRFPGLWQYMRKNQASMQPVLKCLRKARVLDGNKYCKQEVFEAMQMYSEKNGLKVMRSFNGCAVRILRSLERNPNKRAIIEVKK